MKILFCFLILLTISAAQQLRNVGISIQKPQAQNHGHEEYEASVEDLFRYLGTGQIEHSHSHEQDSGEEPHEHSHQHSVGNGHSVFDFIPTSFHLQFSIAEQDWHPEPTELQDCPFHFEILRPPISNA